MTGPDLERHLFHLTTVARAGDAWARDFAASVLRQSRRRGWRPTERQAQTMRRLVAEIFAQEADALFE